MKKQAYNTNSQQSKKPASGKWIRWALLVLVLGLLVGDGVLSGRLSDITLAGSEEETVAAPSELVEEVVEEVVEETPAPAPAPEVTPIVENEAQVTSEIVTSAAAAEATPEVKQENVQGHENTEQIEQTPALAQEELLPAEEELLLAEEEQPAVERTVTIHSNLEETIGVNDTFEMTAELSGFEGVTYTVQWQRNEGFGWEDIGGATGLVLELPASALDVQSGYRLVVNVEA